MSDEEIVKLITQIANNFGISCDDASYIIKSFENFGKEFMMSEADKMFEELGYRLLPKDINNKGILLHYIRNSNLSANESEHIVFYSDKEIKSYYTYCSFNKTLNMQELQAINLKCKELGWIE